MLFETGFISTLGLLCILLFEAVLLINSLENLNKRLHKRFIKKSLWTPPNFQKLENNEKLENIMCFSNTFCYATKFNNQAS